MHQKQNFANGKIYAAVNAAHTNELYIGSTAYPLLCQRFRMHTYAHCHGLTATLAPLMAKPGARIVLVEAFPCTCRLQLRQREQYWMDLLQKHGVPLLNKIRAAK